MLGDNLAGLKRELIDLDIIFITQINKSPVFLQAQGEPRTKGRTE